MEGLVSTIIPVFNRGTMLREAVDSVLAQTWKGIEVIVVDDGSTDDTPEVMRGLQDLHPEAIRLLHQENAGPGAARQAGLSIARGEFVQFLDSDDLLLPEKFALQIAGLRSDPEAGISYGKTYTRERGVRLEAPAQRTGERHRTLFPALLAEPIWPTLAPLYRHAMLSDVGPWPIAKQLEDWRYDAQAAALGVQLHYIDSFIAETRNHDEGRLCHLWKTDGSAMRDRVDAYVHVFSLALRAGVARDAPEMQRFVRSLFWMARIAGANGLPKEAKQLFQLAYANASRPGWDFRLFAIAAAVMGWHWTGRLSQIADRRRGE